jgi:hypothetical protein
MTIASVAALNALALIASSIPSLNPPIPIYAVIASDTFIPLTIPSSWGEFSPRYETQLSDYPLEQGAFALYNKVRRPTVVRVTMIKTGSDLARFAWLAAIQQMEANNPLQLYTLVSPQGVFVDYTLAGLSYDTRPDKGSNLLYLELQFTQVPQIDSSTGQYTNPASALSGPVQQLGQLFTRSASAAQNALSNAQVYITG